MVSPSSGRADIKFFYTGNLYHIYIFICLYQYGLMSLQFIVWVKIQYCIILSLKIFQLWPLGVFSVGSCFPLTYVHHAFLYFLVLQHTQLVFYTPYPSLVSNISPKRMVLETKIWVFSATGAFLPVGSVLFMNRTWIYILIKYKMETNLESSPDWTI